jgi:hypothetical protein
LALSEAPIANRKLTIGNQETHPLPRGGTDLISPAEWQMANIQLNQHPQTKSFALRLG